MRETVGFGMPVSSASSRLLIGASDEATLRSSVSPRESATISSPELSRPAGFEVSAEVREEDVATLRL
jgi:hypothetical protein